MNTRVTPQLPKALLDELKKGSPALVLTVGTDGFPSTAYTWMVALNPTTIRFGADHGSGTLSNLERDGFASLQVITQGNLVFLIKGTILKVKTRIEGTSFMMAMMTMEVVEAKDQSTSAANVNPLLYDWKPEQREVMLAMENAIYAEMRTWKS